jgi:HEAT repeat protein
LLQLIDGGFSYSIHRSGMELLYLPIPPQTRNAVKGFIDTFVDRAGRAAGAVLLLLFTTVLAASIPSLSVIACVLAITWIVAAIAVKRHYMDSFRQALEVKAIEPEALQLRNTDWATMTTLLSRLSSPDERQVLYALDLLSNTHPDRWRAEIDTLINHASTAVRARTIAILASWNDPAITRDAFIHHPDYQTARIATASALRLHWDDLPRNRELLHSLLRDSSAAVSREAIATAGTVRYAEAVPFLIEALANNRLRRSARDALLKFGDTVIPELIRRLSDETEHHAVRRRIPKTLALTGSQRAGDALVQQLHQRDYHLGYAVLKALNRMRVNWPDIEIERDVVSAAIGRERDAYDQLSAAHAWLTTNRMKPEVFSLLIRALEERMEQRFERIFRLVGLIYSPHDIYSVYYNCRIKPAMRPAAIEFLDNLLDAEFAKSIVPLLEGKDDPERQVQFISAAAVLAVLASGDDPWLKTIVTELQTRLGDKIDERRKRRVITR